MSVTGTSLTSLEARLQHQLEQRIKISSNRSLDLSSTSNKKTIDFSSNDYLGLAHSVSQHDLVQSKYHAYTSNPKHSPPYLGSTGSRLLSGNSALPVHLERFLSTVHNRPACLICNSGYDANLSILSSIPMSEDIIILDELVHNSLIMGVKMSRIPLDRVHYFKHNDIHDLERILLSVKKEYSMGSINEKDATRDNRQANILVAVESVYSMDGDIAPLKEILGLALEHGANVIVDEAHGLGIYGYTNAHDLGADMDNTTVAHPSKQQMSNIQNKQQTESFHNERITGGNIQVGGTGVLAALNVENHPALLATVYTFGKAAGCHGAAIVGSKLLIDYLINYARPFIYSTSLPSHSLWTIKCAYDTMIRREGDILREKVFRLVRIFRSKLIEGLTEKRSSRDRHTSTALFLLPSPSPIQAVMCRGNETCVRTSKRLREEGNVAVFPIRSPTVPRGEERIRIILHAHNTEEEVLHLVDCLLQFMDVSFNRDTKHDMLSKL